MLLGCYRRSDAHDPDSYVMACSAVLSLYAPDLIREVTDPRTGIQNAPDFRAFPPNSGELKAFCEAEISRRARLGAYQKLPPVSAAPRLDSPEKLPGRCANLFVRSDMPRYAEMLERTKNADPKDWRSDPARGGIWVSLAWWTDRSGSLGEAAQSLAQEAA